MVFTGRKERIHLAITSANKTVSAPQIACGGSFQITLSLTGAPDVAATPADVVLVLDRSGSMAGAGLTAMQQEADALIDALDLASDGAADGTIGSGSRAGVVSFADTAAQDAALGSTPAELKAAVAALTAGGFSNLTAGIARGLQLFPADTTNRKLMVIFTDGGAGDIDENALLRRRFGDIGGHGDRFQRDHARGFEDRDDEAAAPHQHALAQAGNDHGLIRRHSAPADQQQQQHRQHADANRNDPIHLNVSRSFSLFHAFGSGLRFPAAYLTAAYLTREVCLNASFFRLKTAGIPPFRQGFALPPPLKGRLCM